MIKICYFQSNFVHAMAVFGYLPKLKMGLGLAFGAHFLHENVSSLMPNLWRKFQCHHTFFPSQDIKDYHLVNKKCRHKP